MGQKVNPVGLRLKVIRTWDSRWFAEKGVADLVYEDHLVRTYVKEKVAHAGISKIEIERAAQRLRLKIHTARPGIVIGKKGVEIEALKKGVEKLVKRPVAIDIVEVRRPEVDAQLVAENVAGQLVRRIAFRRAMKRAVSMALKFGAQGVRIACAGRLGGAEMSRREWYREGRVPLHTLRADIDYGFAEAKTTYGVIGVKVWIFKGEVLPEKEAEAAALGI
ncbi:30S ribosomal protein S3 [Dissulfurirhabdus thermomarina]|uniref:Small ribosomal subunit protein uS3 n=1 Tax=Dissulfurirhabdus thermomarina TaxID=1765737 RepID=A0A6N9TNF5_DISTH|nr:30S ribosomal protein S3 [Dissulfurirhabdus thermomarina]NDY41314.1 30S ribosomal protein S3 [Dissulfurirhabdus thermomarina]NMX23303.1 30S ribosomal protein S3 [Dissulfurirhabdus thermomarina]